MKYWILLFSLFYYSSPIFSQDFPSFKNRAKEYKKTNQTRGLLPGAFIDINGDLIDDLLIIDKGMEYVSFLGNTVNRPSVLNKYGPFTHYFDAFGLAVADLNNDGKKDFVTGGSFGYISVFLSNISNFEQIILPIPFLVQTINLTDVNQDGLLDIFICNDTGANTFFINQNGNTFLLSPNVINFSTTPPSDMSGNYGSVWIDVNNDDKMELAIAKCRAGVDDSKDPRRVNVLYMLDEVGQYKDVAKSYQFDLGQQSWAVTFGDFDNDGDMDAFVVNHYEPHVLLENMDGKIFEPKTFSLNPIQSFSFQVVAKDFDNDGLLDIVLSGLEGISFLHNRGNLQFELINSFDFPMPGMSIVVGDINDDGFLDIHSQVTEPLNYPGKTDDHLFVNGGNEHHYFKCNLEGLASNKSAVGAKLQLFGSWGVQMRQITAGEGYGVTHSLQQHFGVGNNTIIDSLKIHWPSGRIDVFSELSVDETYFIQENGCSRKSITIYGEPLILSSSGIELSAPNEFITYNWNNGQTTPKINVTDVGMYFVQGVDSLGCTTFCKPIYVEDGCFDVSTSLLGEEESLFYCNGLEIELTSSRAKTYAWNTGETTQSIQVSQTGIYHVTAQDFCGNTLIDSIRIYFTAVGMPVITYEDTIKKGSTASLYSNLENTLWLDKNKSTILGSGNQIELFSVDRDTVLYSRAFEEIPNQTKKSGILDFPALNAYGSNTVNGGLTFNVYSNLVIESVRVFSDTPGKRKIIIKNKEGAIVFFKECSINFGDNIVELYANLPIGNQYVMTTDEQTNRMNLGYDGPRFLRHIGAGINFPYIIDDILEITQSNYGFNYYYYFYEWVIQFGTKTCYSDDVKIEIFVDSTTFTEDVLPNELHLDIRPNPCSEYFSISFDEKPLLAQVAVYNGQGRRVFETSLDKEINFVQTKEWPPGLYVLHIKINTRLKTVKILKY
ncbi:MAG: FG-GAP-like repeat-containing protein [Saprospiraceae bacterium]